MPAHHVLAEAFRRHGASVLFGLVGHGNIEFVHSWASGGGRYIAARHESQAVAMARGYAKASGGVAVATVTHGPGLTNAVTALTACAKGRTPLVLVVGDIAEGARGRLQDIDHGKVVAPTGSAFMTVTDPRQAAAYANEAVALALSFHCPVVLNVPVNVFEAPSVPPRQLEVAEAAAIHGQPPAYEAIDAAVEILKRSRFPLVIAGRGAVYSCAREALVALASQVGALLGTTLPVRGYFAGEAHPAKARGRK